MNQFVNNIQTLLGSLGQSPNGGAMNGEEQIGSIFDQLLGRAPQQGQEMDYFAGLLGQDNGFNEARRQISSTPEAANNLLGAPSSNLQAMGRQAVQGINNMPFVFNDYTNPGFASTEGAKEIISPTYSSDGSGGGGMPEYDPFAKRYFLKQAFDNGSIGSAGGQNNQPAFGTEVVSIDPAECWKYAKSKEEADKSGIPQDYKPYSEGYDFLDYFMMPKEKKATGAA